MIMEITGSQILLILWLMETTLLKKKNKFGQKSSTNKYKILTFRSARVYQLLETRMIMSENLYATIIWNAG